MQIPIPDVDRDKTAFVSHAALYRFERMQFGLTNAGDTFRKTLEHNWKTGLICLEDAIFSMDVKSRFEHVKYVHAVLRDAGV